MPATDHPDYKNEAKRLNYTVEYLKNHIENLQGKKGKIDKDVNYGAKHYNAENTEQFNELMINQSVQETLSEKLKNLKKGLSKPYFARVDFVEDKSSVLQMLYIGKISLIREKDQKPIIIDWRAPIATLYYDGRIGDANFDCPEGNIKGKIKLKRQYIIEEAKLLEIYDIDVTANDEFLQAALGSNKDNRLKDIVSTIQSEQNKVIRADMWSPLVVQGAAGGGKTTIALHRIAYLLYNEKSMKPENFMIIAPNRFFLSYISEVLPDLGVENVVQTTYEDFAMKIIGKRIKVKNPYDKLCIIIKNKDKSLINISKFKSSLKYKSLIDEYISFIESEFIPKEDFKVENFVLVKYDDINSLFIKDYKDMPMMKRVNEIKKTLRNELDRKEEPIIESLEEFYESKLNDVRKMEDSPERRKKVIKITFERDFRIQKVKKKSKTAVDDYVSKICALSPIEYYEDFLKKNKNKAKKVKAETLKNVQEGTFEIEDLAPLMYLKYMVYGNDKKFKIRHVVIDEAQDLSPFQLFVIKKIIRSDSFTILGDLCQGIYSYRGINDWNGVSDEVFGKGNYSFLTLKQSYRTTIEIMDAANKVIGFLKDSKLPQSKPVIRHGEPVHVIKKSNMDDVVNDISEKLLKLESEGFKSAAIICKDMNECKRIKEKFKKCGNNIRIINGSENDYTGGISIIPSYLVKGLEFDAVFIADASSKKYSTDPLDVKLLYISMTRPLHRLNIYYVGEKAEML